ncbi:MAG: hypothetical protein RH949_24195 [Coleofasciculus sp. A1-SPW-01]|uniref:hypothetical protein n=1 Tax=Coleofasciculus sp. A1-SPW-01 TaxID=3070819 RepID=UPI0032F3003A
MAEIRNARLVITRTGDRANGTITGEIVWTGNELALNPQFNLEASLRGSDRRRDDRIPANLFDPDGLLDNPISPDGMNPKSFRLTFNVPSNVLDEDDSIFNRDDEVYAVLNLKPVEIAVATARTNTVRGRF